MENLTTRTVSHAQYREEALIIAEMHGRHADSVTIPEHTDSVSTYFVIGNSDGVYGVAVIRPNAIGTSIDLGGFTARPGWGGAALDAILDRLRHVPTVTLDCFDKGGFLPKVYAGRGFVEYAREPFDVEMYDALADGTTPDVVFMRRVSVATHSRDALVTV